jgi:ATP-dependent Clp protease ATP-binding subunit ClpA
MAAIFFITLLLKLVPMLLVALIAPLRRHWKPLLFVAAIFLIGTWLGPFEIVAVLATWILVLGLVLTELRLIQQIDFFQHGMGKTMADILARLTDVQALQAGLEMARVGSASKTIDGAALMAGLNDVVFGQAGPIGEIVSQIETRFAKTKRSKPVGVFLLAGPPGTGKTHFAKELSNQLYGANSLLLLEMTKFSQPHTVSALFGQSKGYAGSDSYGQLTAALKSKPERVVCLDEIEKAHADVHKNFLNAWNDGFATELSTGEKVSTRDAIFILTTNACQREINDLQAQYQGDPEGLSDACKAVLQQTFVPEVLSRIDRVFAFLPLKGLDIARVVAQAIERSVGEYDMKLASFDHRILIEKILEAEQKSADAREIARMIERQLDKKLVDVQRQGAKEVALIPVDGGGIDVVVVR